MNLNQTDNGTQARFEKFLDHWHRLSLAILKISNMSNHEIQQHIQQHIYHNPLEIDGVATYREFLFKDKPILQMQKTGTKFFITHDKDFVGGRTLDDLAKEF